MDYSKLLNPIAQSIQPSGIREFFGIAATRKNCISLGVGEPDFSTPTAFSQAGINSIIAGKTQYTANAGLLNFARQFPSIRNNFRRSNTTPKTKLSSPSAQAKA